MKNIKYLFALIGIAMLSSCFFSKKLDKKPLTPYLKNMDIQYRLVHLDAQNSKLFIKSNAKNYEITIKAYTSFKARGLLFEQSAIFDNALNKIEIINIPLQESQYVVELSVVNIATKAAYLDVIAVNKLQDSEQTIMAYQSNGLPLINNYSSLNTALRFKHTNPNIKRLFIKYFDEGFKAARAPFIHQNWKFSPEKSFKSVEIIAPDEEFQLSQKGLYFIQTDTSSMDGLFVNSFSDEYPNLTQIQELVESTRYITKNEEYLKLSETNATKSTLDAFWLERGGTQQRSKELIKIYYNRVQSSNKYFTTYKEGWKTDRGLIYIIFGPPSVIKKTENLEYWYYSSPNHQNSFDFFFDKKNGEHLLRRSQYYEYYWKDKIFEWRKGMIEEYE